MKLADLLEVVKGPEFYHFFKEIYGSYLDIGDGGFSVFDEDSVFSDFNEPAKASLKQKKEVIYRVSFTKDDALKYGSLNTFLNHLMKGMSSNITESYDVGNDFTFLSPEGDFAIYENNANEFEIRCYGFVSE